MNVHGENGEIVEMKENACPTRRMINPVEENVLLKPDYVQMNALGENGGSVWQVVLVDLEIEKREHVGDVGHNHVVVD